MRDLLYFLLLNIVDHSDDIEIQEHVDGSFIEYRVSLHEDDYGRVIGSNGHRIKAIRKVVSILAIKKQLNLRIVLED